MLGNKNSFIIISIFIFLVIRLLYLLIIFSIGNESNSFSSIREYLPKSLRENKENIINNDAIYYDNLAKSFSDGNGIEIEPNKDGRIDVVAPMYPVFLGTMYFIFGSSVHTTLFLSLLLDIAILLVVLLIFKQFNYLNSDKSNIILILFLAFYPPYLVNIIVPLTEPLFTLFLCLFVWFYLKNINERKISYLILSSLFLGLATLTRPITLLFPVFLILYELIFIKKYKKSETLQKGLIFSFVFLAVLSPWTIRNYVKYDRIILVNTNSNLAVIGSDVNTSAGEIKNPVNDSVKIQKYLEAENKSTFETYSDLIINMLKNPIEHLKLWGTKFVRLWLNLGFQNKPSMGSYITAFMQTIILLTVLCGIIKNKLFKDKTYLLILLILYITFFHTVFFTAKIRFIVPLLPIVVIIFVITVTKVFERGNNNIPKQRMNN